MLSCLPNPGIKSLSVYFADADNRDNVKREFDRFVSKDAVINAVNEIIESSGKRQIRVIDVYGATLFDYRKYRFPMDNISIGTQGLGWSGMNPAHYGIYPYKYAKGGTDGVWIAGRENVALPLMDVKKIIEDISKKLIGEFNPVNLSLYTENSEYLHLSQILYFKYPYLFPLEFSSSEFSFDDNAKHQMEEVRKVMTYDEIVSAIRDYGDEGFYDTFLNGDGGLGIIDRWDIGRPASGYVSVLASLRQTLRDRGMKLPIGDIETMNGIYQGWKRDVSAGKTNNWG